MFHICVYIYEHMYIYDEIAYFLNKNGTIAYIALNLLFSQILYTTHYHASMNFQSVPSQHSKETQSFLSDG